jgi:hypothetical protein
MSFEYFHASLEQRAPPAGLPALLAAMWWDAQGDWNRAHEIAQDVGSAQGAWVHAYLHRKEGDEANSGYWYRQAGKPHSREPIQSEWEQIVRALLATANLDNSE